MRFIYPALLVAGLVAEPLNCYQRPVLSALDAPIVYTVITDTSERATTLIRAATRSWMRAIPVLQIVVIRGICDPAIDRSNTWCILTTPPEDLQTMGCPEGSVGCTTRYPHDEFAVIRIAAALNDDDFLRVAGHEMGHALGIHGHGHRGQIMADRVGWQSPNVTCEDVRMFWAVRGVEIGDCR